MHRYHKILLAVFAAVWIWAAIQPKYPDDWLLENVLVILAVPFFVLTGYYFKLSNLSYTLITVFMVLHLIGSHYTYAEVPFGHTLQHWLGAGRNMFDRMVHFSFGFLLAYPVREIFLRLAHVKGFWGYYLPLDVTLSLSAVYELIEWGTAEVVSPGAGLAFLGSQGDVWDAQKDMLAAGIGALGSMLVIAALNWRYNPNFAREMRQSFVIERGDRPLGEVKLREWLSRKSERLK
jgi:putative membrane protein